MILLIYFLDGDCCNDYDAISMINNNNNNSNCNYNNNNNSNCTCTCN